MDCINQSGSRFVCMYVEGMGVLFSLIPDLNTGGRCGAGPSLQVVKQENKVGWHGGGGGALSIEDGGSTMDCIAV